LTQGDAAAAEHHFERELACEDSGHLYARECCSATWYARGAHAFHRGDHRMAAAAFAETLRRVPRHPLALAANVGGDGDDAASHEALASRLQAAAERGAHVDVAVARAVRQAATAQTPDTATILTALQRVPPGISGWYLPVEPMLRPLSDAGRWGATLALLQARAA
jgi:hypothetical protein